MKNLMKRMILGTPLEPLARSILSSLSRNRYLACLSKRIDKNSLYDIQTLEVMKRVLRRDSNCVDIGCHKGSILRDMLQLAPEGTHFAFEPLPQMFEELKETFSEIPNVILYDYALSNTSGSTHFQYVESNPSFSGFRQRKYQNPNERIQQITVKTDLLDNLIPKHTPIHFIKVDVEGAELQVFKGAIETIKNNRPVLIFEHGLGAADCYGTSPEDLFDLLSGQCGMRIFLMEKWLGTSSANSLSRVDFSEQFSSGSNYYFMAAP